jgi:hypothetical protein
MNGFSEFLSTPLTLPASVAGALAALFFVIAVLAVRKAGRQAFCVSLSVVVLVLAAIAVVAVLNRMAASDAAAERRALEQRETALAAQALAPGSALGCLDSAAGEKVESACENAVFADPQSVTAAVAYTAARLTLLADGLGYAHRADPDFADSLAGLRRAVELDRFGIAAHVLASRDGCTAAKCDAFALLRDASALKANLRVDAYNAYVTRHVAAWNSGTPAAEKQPPVASASPPPQAPEPAVASVAAPATPGNPVPSRFDFPSAASIPPVSIMNAEPPLPPGASSANAAVPPVAANAAPPTNAPATVPMPPLRPQNLAPAPQQ